MHAHPRDDDAAHERLDRSEGEGHDLVPVGVGVQGHDAQFHGLPECERGGVALRQMGDDPDPLGELDHTHSVGDGTLGTPEGPP